MAWQKGSKCRSMLTQEGFMVEFDEAGSIGRRYARADEAGIQLGITIDYDTLKERRLRFATGIRGCRFEPNQRLATLLHSYFQGKIKFEDLGTLIET